MRFHRKWASFDFEDGWPYKFSLRISNKHLEDFLTQSTTNSTHGSDTADPERPTGSSSDRQNLPADCCRSQGAKPARREASCRNGIPLCPSRFKPEDPVSTKDLLRYYILNSDNLGWKWRGVWIRPKKNDHYY